MVQLVSLEQANTQVRRDTGDDDADLILKIKAASNMVINYLGATRSAELITFDSDGEVEFDSNDEPVGVPEEIQAAVLYIVGMLYNDRDGEEFNKGNANNAYARNGEVILPRIVHFILDPLKLPTIA